MKRIFKMLPALALAAMSWSAPIARVAVPAAAVAIVTTSSTAHAYELYVGTITSTGASVTQATTAVPFTFATGFFQAGGKLSVQCDAAACIRMGKGAISVSCSVSSASNGIQLSSGQLFDIPTDGAVDTLAVISVSGTADCVVYRVAP